MAWFKDLWMDANDHQAQADWWCSVLGYVRREAAKPRLNQWPVPIVDPTGHSR